MNWNLNQSERNLRFGAGGFEAAKEAAEIFDRWADEIDDLDEDFMEDEDYEPDEYYSD